MTAEYTARATKSVLNSKKGFCKFLSANDTGATGGHQFGILISKSAIDMMFNRQELEQNTIPKRTVKIRWQDDFETVSRFTFYESKNELRITRFGRGFPFLILSRRIMIFRSRASSFVIFASSTSFNRSANCC